MTIRIAFETHSWSEDNDAGLASGWLPGQLSARGRDLAVELGERYTDDPPAAVFCSDLERAAETARIAFGRTSVPVLLDWRLRECDYGTMNGKPSKSMLRERRAYIDQAYPGGESWRQAIERAGRLLGDLPGRHSGQRVLLIGHVATRWALDHYLGGRSVEDLVNEDFVWREGWNYELTAWPFRSAEPCGGPLAAPRSPVR